MGSFYSDKGLEYLNNLASGKAQYVFELDTDGNPIYPALVLAHRNGDKVGVINNAQGLRQIFDLQETFEISFDVVKHRDGKDCEVWDDIKDFMLVYVPMYKLWFEIYVTLRESDGLVKSVSGVHLPDAELSQIMIYNMEINSEEDLEAHESPVTGEYIKTVLYNPLDPSVSMLHRLLADKAPHYSIYHVDDRLQSLWDEFDFNGVSISEALDEIAERFNCIVICGEGGDSDSPSRTISVYDMLDYCPSCGKRGDYTDGMCTECGNTEHLIPGYGSDTTVFISNENLANEVVSTNDVDNMKNCFRLEAGDDLMTAAIVACNPAGSQYVWYYDDKTRGMMSPELQTKLIEYDTLLNYYNKEHQTVISAVQVAKYNDLVAKYRTMNEDIQYLPDADASTPASEIVGYTDLVKTSYNIYDFATYLKTTMMPKRSSDETSAQEQIGYIDLDEMSPLGVSNAETVSASTAALAVKNYVKVFVDTSKYEITVSNPSISQQGNDRVWSGTVELTSYSDEDDTARLGMTVTLSDSLEATTKQKIDKLLAQADVDNSFGVVNIMSLSCVATDSDYSPFELELKKHSLDNLNMFYSCAQDALNILIEQGVGDDSTSSVYQNMYLPLITKISMLEAEAALRESEYKLVYNPAGENALGECIYKIIATEISKINNALNMENFLGEDLWLEYISYRREAEFSNTNFISDGLTNEELFEKAELFYKRAEKELIKSATLQHTITSTLKNLMVIPEFAPLLSYFKLGNWLRIKIDEKIYKLRLASYTLDYDNLDDLQVTFTDVHDQSSIISTIKRTFAQSRARSSSYTAPTFTSNATDALYYSSTGILVRTWDDETGQFVSAQLRVLAKGIYYTDNTWTTVQNVRATISEAYSRLEDLIEHSSGIFTTAETQQDGSTIYYLHDNPDLEDSDIVWKMTANAMAVSTNGGQTWNAGITVDGDVIARIINAMGLNADWINAGTLRVVAQDQTVVFEADMDNKSVVINGDSVFINGTQFSQGTTITDAINVPTTIAQAAQATANNAIHTITTYYGTSNSANTQPSSWSTTVPQGGDGIFIWQYTLIQTANGSTQTDPVCLSMRGIPGTQGEQGIPGVSNYVHIKYAPVANPTDNQMTENTDEYIGICVDTNVNDPTTASSYTWTKFQGVDGDQGIPGTNGEDGRTTYVHFAYASSADGSVGFSTSPYNGATHIGVLSDFVENDSQTYSDYAWSLIKGADGKGVSSTSVQYASSADGTTAPSSGWSSSIPTVTQGEYLWTRTTITYTDNTTSVSYSISHSGIDGRNGTDGDDGQDGTDGRGISSTATTYASSSNGTTPPSSGWESNIPTVAAGNYLWTKTTYTFTDSTTQDVYSSAKQGAVGESVQTITNYYVATSLSSGVTTSNPSDGTWTTAIQTITPTKPYLWNYEVITGSNGTTLSTTAPIIIGHFGTDGTNGVDGTSIDSIVEYYAKSTSNSSSPAESSYSTSVPTLDSTNKYLWNYEEITYLKPDGTTSTDKTLKRIIGVYGDTGEAGYNTATVYLYQRGTSAPSKPSNSLTYTFSTKALSGTLGNWSTTIPSGSNPIYVTVATALSRTATDTIESNEWSSPVILAQNGATGGSGANGVNSATIYLYQRASSAPNKPSGTLTYTFSTKSLSGTPGNNWGTVIPSGITPIYVTFATAASTTDTDTIETSEWSTPAILAQNGADGQMLYATCSTAAGTAAKVATLASGTLTLTAGAAVAVTFTNANTVANPTLNVSSTGAKTICAGGAALTATSKYNWTAGATVVFVYDGTYWQMDGTAALDKIDAIDVGGRNLLRNSNKYSSWYRPDAAASYITTTSDYLKFTPPSSSNWWMIEPLPVNISINDWDKTAQYTISIDFKIEGKTGSPNYPYMAVATKSSTAGGYGTRLNEMALTQLGIAGTSTWARYSQTFTGDYTTWQQRNTGTPVCVTIYIWLYSNSSEYTAAYFRNIKLEKGNKATDWTPAPEDVEEEIASVEDTATEALNKHGFCSCSTAAGTTAKTASLTGFQLKTGSTVHVTFTYANSAANATLNINSTGAKTIRWNNENLGTSPSPWRAGECVTFVYNGTYWVVAGQSNISADNIVSGSITADRIKANVIDAVNGGTGKINAAKINTSEITIAQSQVTDLTTALSGKETAGAAATALTDAKAYAQELSAAQNAGKMFFTDPSFASGIHLQKYNNTAGTAVTVTRTAKSSDNPMSDTSYEATVKSAGSASPGIGGFAFDPLPTARANAVYVYRVIAKIPTGRNIEFANNPMGNGMTKTWLTPRAGTGKFTEYVIKVVCGVGGTLSTGGHFYLDGTATSSSSPVTWYVAYANVFDMTNKSDVIKAQTTADTAQTTASNAATAASNAATAASNAQTAATNAAKTATNYITNISGGGITVTGNSASSQVSIASSVKVIADSTHFTEMTSSGFNIYSGSATNPIGKFQTTGSGTSALGELRLYNASGNQRAFIGAGTSNGYMYFNNSSGKLTAWTGTVDGTQGGFIVYHGVNGSNNDNNKAIYMTKLTFRNTLDQILVNNEPAICFYNVDGDRQSWYSLNRAYIKDNFNSNSSLWSEGYVVHGQTAEHGMTMDYENFDSERKGVSIYVDGTKVYKALTQWNSTSYSGYPAIGRQTNHHLSYEFKTVSGYNYLCFWIDGTEVYRLQQTSYSDKRIKTDIEPIREGYKKAVGAVNIDQFRYDFSDPVRQGSGLVFGVVAQDLIEELEGNDIRYEETPLVADVDNEDESLYSVEYTQFLLARLAYDEDRIKDLEETLVDLTSRFESLENT